MTITNRPVLRDTGYNGQIKSLSGVMGGPGMGLALTNTEIDAEASAVIPVAQNNQKRVWLTIQNYSTHYLQVVFGSDPTFINVARINPLEIFQITNDFPWTGAVAVYHPVDISCYVTEAMIDG